MNIAGFVVRLVPLSALCGSSLAIAACGAPADETVASTASASSTLEAQEVFSAMSILRGLNQLDVYTKRSIDATCTDTEGRMGAGEDIHLLHYQADGKLLPDMGAVVFAGGSFSLLHGSVGGPSSDARSVEAGDSVWLHHYSVNNVRAACENGSFGPFANVLATQEGTIAGRTECGSARFPHAGFAAAIDTASTHVTAAGAAATYLHPTRTGTQLVFTADPQKGITYFEVTPQELDATWSVIGQGRVIVEVRGAGVINFNLPGGLVAPSAWVLVNFPDASEVWMGGPKYDQRVNYDATVLAPNATVHFYYGQLNGGLYASAFDGNPYRLSFTNANVTCDMPDGQVAAGGQINHWPFTSCFPDTYFGGKALP